MRTSVHGGGQDGSPPPQAVEPEPPWGCQLSGVSASLPSGWVRGPPARLRCVGARSAAPVSSLLASGRKTDVALVKLFLIRHA